MTLAFPTLFPDGAGDFYQPRLTKIDLGDYFKHLLRFRGGRFAQHRRFPWFALNTVQRARTRSCSNIFVKQRHDAPQLNAADIRTLLSDNDETIVRQMMRYGANLRGTRAYWATRRQELMDFIREKGCPDVFWTLSAADLQWPDLHRHMPPHGQPSNDGRAARQQRRQALNNNPHIAAAYLDRRVQLFLNELLHPLLGVRHFWYRYEWQERGSGHVHGFFWLDDAPKVDDIDWDVLKSADKIASDEQQSKMRRFSEYWGRIITACSPNPRRDENIPLIGDHPSSLERHTVLNTKEELADLLNWTERHTKCTPGYCLVKRTVPGVHDPQLLCRFDYPMSVRANPGVGLDSRNRVRFEPARNDPLLNSYNPAMIVGWRANLDIKPILSKEAAINYIAKYASKDERQAPAFPQLLASVANSMDDNGSAQMACRKTLNKMLGERSYSAQETAHLLLGIPLVRASVTFHTVYIGADGGFRQVHIDNDKSSNVAEHDNSFDRPLTGPSVMQRYIKRPPSMESLSLHDVLTKFVWTKSEWKRKKECTDTVLRIFPRFSPDPENDNYDDFCRTKLILHHPFRNLDALQQNSWTETFEQCLADNHRHSKDTLRCFEDEQRQSIEDDDTEHVVDADVNDMDEEDWQAWARLRPDKDIPLYGLDDIGRRPFDDSWDINASRTQWNDVNLLSSWIDERKREAQRQHDTSHAINIGSLHHEQRVIFDQYMDAYSKSLLGEHSPQLLFNMDGTAGCGKTYLIAAISQGLHDMAVSHLQPDPFLVFAPSGVAALNVHGRTIHSGFSLPMCGFHQLSGSRLAAQQLQWKHIRFVIIDEKSMLGLRTLAQIDSRCRQFFPQHANIPFGNLNVTLVGDFAQLPPVGDTPLYSQPSTALSETASFTRDGSALYHLFSHDFSLNTIHRQVGDSPQQIRFKSLLRNASLGSLTVDDWELLKTRYVGNLSDDEQLRFLDAPCVYTTRADIDHVNVEKLQLLNEPCARVAARHDGGAAAKKASPDDAGGLDKFCFLAKRAKVMIIRNLWQSEGTVEHTLNEENSLSHRLRRSCQRYNGCC
jgi:ATP-dependent DNA helicase PIF1